jgi:hypothetical protein
MFEGSISSQGEDLELIWLVVCQFMVLNATFNNISIISWQSVLLVEQTGGPGENQFNIILLQKEDNI